MATPIARCPARSDDNGGVIAVKAISRRLKTGGCHTSPNTAAKLLSMDEARCTVANVAKLPGLRRR